MWDITITPSLDPASLLASFIGLVHAPTISGWAMALIEILTNLTGDITNEEIGRSTGIATR